MVEARNMPGGYGYRVEQGQVTIIQAPPGQAHVIGRVHRPGDGAFEAIVQQVQGAGYNLGSSASAPAPATAKPTGAAFWQALPAVTSALTPLIPAAATAIQSAASRDLPAIMRRIGQIQGRLQTERSPLVRSRLQAELIGLQQQARIYQMQATQALQPVQSFAPPAMTSPAPWARLALGGAILVGIAMFALMQPVRAR
jgi:hypothetical protein